MNNDIFYDEVANAPYVESGDKSTVLLGLPTDSGGIGKVEVYQGTGPGKRVKVCELTMEIGDRGYGFGGALGLSRNGNVLAVGSSPPDEVFGTCGTVFLYLKTGKQEWTRVTSLAITGTGLEKDYQLFTEDIVISKGGLTLVIGGGTSHYGGLVTFNLDVKNAVWLSTGAFIDKDSGETQSDAAVSTLGRLRGLWSKT